MNMRTSEIDEGREPRPSPKFDEPIDKSPFYPTIKDPIDEKKIETRLVWLQYKADSNVAKY